jgi:hypothetical protein
MLEHETRSTIMEQGKARTIFVVTSGDYSAYGINAMFTHRADAEEYMKLIDGSDVEEWTLDEFAGGKVVTVFQSHIAMSDGKISEMNPTKVLDSALDHGKTKVNRTSWANQRGTFSQAVSMSVVSQQHANKIVVEARQAWLREQAETPAP